MKSRNAVGLVILGMAAFAAGNVQAAELWWQCDGTTPQMAASYFSKRVKIDSNAAHKDVQKALEDEVRDEFRRRGENDVTVGCWSTPNEEEAIKAYNEARSVAKVMNDKIILDDFDWTPALEYRELFCPIQDYKADLRVTWNPLTGKHSLGLLATDDGKQMIFVDSNAPDTLTIEDLEVDGAILNRRAVWKFEVDGNTFTVEAPVQGNLIDGAKLIAARKGKEPDTFHCKEGAIAVTPIPTAETRAPAYRSRKLTKDEIDKLFTP